MSTEQAIAGLKQAFPADQVLLPGTELFNKQNSSYLSQLESDITPAAIFRPKSTQDVSTFLQTIQPFVACADVAFAIRGGGQQPLPGCANIQGGITLDLGLLVGSEIQNGIVKIAAGERWGPVYDKLHEEGLGVTGSRSAKGGIGGLALAGGLSFFSTREGLICDNVVNYEVVLASGQIVNANANENPDLWRSLRGGGNNFGIVTRFDLRTFKQGEFWGGAVFYFPPSFPAQIEALVQELKKPNASKETHIMLSLLWAAQFGQPMCLNQLYYTQAVENPPELKPFSTMQPQLEQLTSLRMINMKDAAAEQAAMAMDGIRCAYMNTTVKADVPTLNAAADTFSSALEGIKQIDGLVCSLTLQPYPVSLLEKCVSEGGNCTGLDPAGGPLVSVLLLLYWKNASDDEVILKVTRGVLEKIEQDAASRGQAVPFVYMNYASDFQDPIGSYGAENQRLLRETSKKYDPEGIFQKGVPGGFKLFK